MPSFPKEWLKKIVDIEEIEKEIVSNKNIVASWLDRWKSFKTTIQPGDEIWFFSSSEDSWHSLAGREGYAVVRKGNVFSQILTKMS